jgi:adenylate cyclase
MHRSGLTPLRIALGLGVLLALLRLDGCRYLDLMDARAIDYRLLQRGPEPVAPDVVIVAVDDASIEKLGRWPWSRATIARLLDELTKAGPAVVGFDIVQSEATVSPEIEGLLDHVSSLSETTREEARRELRSLLGEDETLARSVRASGRTVLGYFFDFDAEPLDTAARLGAYDIVRDSSSGAGESHVPQAPRVVGNLPLLDAAARDVGYFNVLPDRGDGSVRRLPLVIRYGKKNTLPLALAMLRLYLPKAPAVLQYDDYGVESVRVGKVSSPSAADGQLLLNYRGPGGTFPHVPAADVLEGRVPAQTFRGKMVLVGVTATAVGDIRVTPFDGMLPGVEVHATAIDNVLRGDFLRRPRWLTFAEVGVILVCALVLGLALDRARGRVGLLVAALLLAGYLAGSQWVFVHRGLPLSLVYPVLAISLTYVGVSVEHYVIEERERRKTRKALELYLSPSMARLVSEQPDRLKLGGERREMTVLFSDIRGFSGVSEGFEPEELVDLINMHLGEMTDAIFRHQGMLDKYIGDAVMAVWGAPLPQPDHAARACATALEMQERLRRLNEKWQSRGWPRLRMGVGVNSGPMIFGNMGSAHHLSLTVMGNAVDLGSRLEGVTKLYGSPIIAGEVTVAEAAETICTRELDVVRVKGKSLPLRIFEILAPGSERQRWEPLVEAFESGRAAYRTQHWDEAIRIFAALREQWPDDRPTALYLERCALMKASAVPPDWDGVTAMEFK